ncbi:MULTISPECIES: HYC_CC_PP family protein [unclassified Aureispira]|uniref:HYC_CC_PP family protein n=1 Tax=unclassified Aureispira TaxID=2649989 RepID=UPI00069650B2|nr:MULTISPECIES: hypothetical protein [unclassified Aureispira]WMX12006.1 hypothetical protein QP953_14360 [Aureispira sp. CCB-E]
MFLKLIHILNIWTVLFSTIGIATYSHYCQDELKAIAFFVNTIQPCCKKQKAKEQNAFPKVLAKTCCSNSKNLYLSCFDQALLQQQNSFKKKPCCLDEQSLAKSDLNAVSSELDLETTAQYLHQLPFYAPIFPKQHTILGFSSFAQHPIAYFFPPPDVPLYILHQSFLC